jgi:hypothetical protein
MCSNLFKMSIISFFMASSCFALAGCQADAGDFSTDASADGALTALTPAEIVGEIEYGETSAPINYTDTPRYRALTFEGHAGDHVTITVHSAVGHARAWLLYPNFSNLAYDDNLSGAAHDAHVEATLPDTATYFIAFRDAFQENATFTVSLDGPQVPPPPPPPPPPACDPEVTNCGPGKIVHGTSRFLTLGFNQNNAVIETWGKGLWDGFVSFKAIHDKFGTSDGDIAELVDATGAVYRLTASTTSFDRLPLPLTLRASTTSSLQTQVNLTDITFEVTNVHPISGQALHGKFNGVAEQTVATIGADIPGVKLNFNAAASFFHNFTNGNACARLKLNGQFLTAAAPTASLSLTAPLVITTSATCISSRLANPQNPNDDYTLALSNISVGDPQ